jgi:hypothetical protein
VTARFRALRDDDVNADGDLRLRLMSAPDRCCNEYSSGVRLLNHRRGRYAKRVSDQLDRVLERNIDLSLRLLMRPGEKSLGLRLISGRGGTRWRSSTASTHFRCAAGIIASSFSTSDPAREAGITTSTPYGCHNPTNVCLSTV